MSNPDIHTLEEPMGDAEQARTQLAKAAEILSAKGYTVETVAAGERTHLTVTR